MNECTRAIKNCGRSKCRINEQQRHEPYKVHHKESQRQLTENYNVLWDKYESMKNYLNKYKDRQKYLNHKISELNEEIRTRICQIKEKDVNIERWKDSYYRIKDDLFEKRNTVACLRNQNQTKDKKLETILADRCNISEILKKTIHELEIKTEENRKLTLTLEKYCIENLKFMKNVDILNSELAIEKYRNAELNTTVCEQKQQLQNQIELSEKLNETIEELKQMVVKEKVQADDSINKLKKDKLCVVNEKEELEKNLKEHLERLQCLKVENERLKIQNNALQCKLDAAIKNSDEKLKFYAEKMKRFDEEKKEQLSIEITLKNRIKTELTEQLLMAKRMYEVETKKVYDLEKKLKNVDKPSKMRKKTSSLSVSPFFENYTKVFGELKSTGEYPYLSSSEEINTERLEKNQNFEKFISRYETIISRFNK